LHVLHTPAVRPGARCSLRTVLPAHGAALRVPPLHVGSLSIDPTRRDAPLTLPPH
jgi:hypothetical protein